MINFLNILMREKSRPRGARPPTAAEYQEWLDGGSKGALGWYTEGEMQLLCNLSPEEFESISIDLIAAAIKEVHAKVINEVEQANPKKPFRVVGFPTDVD